MDSRRCGDCAARPRRVARMGAESVVVSFRARNVAAPRTRGDGGFSNAQRDARPYSHDARLSRDSTMRPRVLHLVSSFRTGGSERQAVQLVRLLKESGRYDLHLAALDGSGELRTEAERMGLTEIPEYPLKSFY